MTSEMRREQIEWRKSQVLELSSRGHNSREIAAKLQVHHATVCRDLIWIRKQAQNTLRKHISETLPMEYEKTKSSFDQVLKIAWSIINPNNIDHKTIVQVLTLISECSKYRYDLITNGPRVSDAMKCVAQIEEKIFTLKKVERINNQAIDREEEGEEEKTYNSVF
jgi:hypothetical protein